MKIHCILQNVCSWNSIADHLNLYSFSISKKISQIQKKFLQVIIGNALFSYSEVMHVLGTWEHGYYYNFKIILAKLHCGICIFDFQILLQHSCFEGKETALIPVVVGALYPYLSPDFHALGYRLYIHTNSS